jgi:biopolymer transport protein ExbD
LSSWDVFDADSLELQRGLSTLQVQAALAAGDLRDDDLARPAGTKTPWLPISQIDELRVPGRVATPAEPDQTPPAPEPTPEAPEPDVSPPEWSESRTEFDDVSFPVVSDTDAKAGDNFPPADKPSPPVPSPANWAWNFADDDDDEDDEDDVPAVHANGPSDPFLATPADPAKQWELDRYDLDADLGDDPSSVVALPVVMERSSQIALPAVATRDWSGAAVAQGAEGDGDEEEEVFTFARRSADKIEELDLAPMVDVAFQLVLFFMVTATTVLYKTLEVPKPSQERAPEAVAQGRSKSVDDLRDDFIVVEIDPSGTFKLDREPVAGDMETLVERLRAARDKTARKTMLLSADYTTPHRYAVLAIDAANEIGLGIAVARPKGKEAQAPAPALFPINPKGQPKAKAADKGA